VFAGSGDGGRGAEREKGETDVGEKKKMQRLPF
jgi:hypothetical protein